MTASEHDIIRPDNRRWICRAHHTQGEIGLSCCNPTETGVRNDGTPTAELMADLATLDQRIERIGNWAQVQFKTDKLTERQFHQLVEALGLIANSARWVRKDIERAEPIPGADLAKVVTAMSDLEKMIKLYNYSDPARPTQIVSDLNKVYETLNQAKASAAPMPTQLDEARSAGYAAGYAACKKEEGQIQFDAWDEGFTATAKSRHDNPYKKLVK